MVFFVVLAMVLVGSCAVQSANSGAQRIVGTWTVEFSNNSNVPNGTVFVFNANGTATRGGENFFYGIAADSGIFLGYMRYPAIGLYMSPDGKRIVLFVDSSEYYILQKNKKQKNRFSQFTS
jgi:hypothetical protein